MRFELSGFAEGMRTGRVIGEDGDGDEAVVDENRTAAAAYKVRRCLGPASDLTRAVDVAMRLDIVAVI